MVSDIREINVYLPQGSLVLLLPLLTPAGLSHVLREYNSYCRLRMRCQLISQRAMSIVEKESPYELCNRGSLGCGSGTELCILELNVVVLSTRSWLL